MNHDRVMLLIDADNVSLDVIEQAVPWVDKHSAARTCGAPTARPSRRSSTRPLFKRLSIRPMVNLAAGKNSTDIALAIDAIDLVDRRAARRGGDRVVGQRLRAAGRAPAREGLPRRRHRAGGQDRRRDADGVRRLRGAGAPTPASRTPRRRRRARKPAPKAPAPRKAAAPPQERRGDPHERASRRTAPAAGAATPPPDCPTRRRRSWTRMPELAARRQVELRVAAERLREPGC